MVAAFANRNITLVTVPWQDETDYSSYDKILLMKPWGYSNDFSNFKQFLTKMESFSVDNSIEVIRWNLDKRYLAEL